MKNSKNTLEKIITSCLYVFLFIYFKPDIIRYVPAVNNAINLITIASVIVVLPAYLLVKKKTKSSITILIIFAIVALATVLNGESPLYFFKNYSPIILLALFLEVAIRVDEKKALNALSNTFVILTIANYLHFLLMPKMTYEVESRYMLLGYDNTVYPLLIMGSSIVLAINYYLDKKIWKRSLIMLILTVLTCLGTYSSTAKVGAVLLIIFVAMIQANQKLACKILKYRRLLILGIIAAVAVVFFQAQTMFSSFIEYTLQRNATLTGRTEIWDNAIYSIKRHPIIGVGAIEPEMSRYKYGVFHAHNTYLQYIFMGGIATIIAYVYLLFQQGNVLRPDKFKKTSLYLIMGIALYLVFSIDEYFLRNQTFFALVIVAQNLPLLETKVMLEKARA